MEYNKIKKDWVDYRIEEMEEKAGIKQVEIEYDYPEYDMDGCHFIPDYDDEENKYNDAFMASISKRLSFFSIS